MGLLNWIGWDGWKGTEEIPNANTPGVPPASVGMIDYTPGDPHGLEIIEVDPPQNRGLTVFAASGWDGWPGTWNTPIFADTGISGLVDAAWLCIDLNARILSTMPIYKLRGGRIVEPEPWMTNPDPRIYRSWIEFAKQLFWEYHLGQAFVLATDYFSNGWPMFFRVIPQALVTSEIVDGRRRHMIGQIDITADVLQIPYNSSTDQADGWGPLQAAGARMTAAAVMAQYTSTIVANGGISLQTLETEQMLSEDDAQEISDQWAAARLANVGRIPVLDGGIKLVDHQMSPKDMALLEVSQFTDSRIAVLLGVPPFLAGLPSGGDSMTYGNVTSLFDYHDREALRPAAATVMAALSGWALPRGSTAELNRDEYSRPALLERATAYEKLVAVGALSSDEIRAMERLMSLANTPATAAAALTGSDL